MRPQFDICVIGAGSAGLSVAAGAAQLGARTVLIEADRMGGDCLNTGCVPSKTLLAAGKLSQAQREAGIGRDTSPSAFPDLSVVHRRIRGVIDRIAVHDSADRFEALGCRVVRAQAHFLDKQTVQADSKQIRARRFVIATGSRAHVPSIPGLEKVPYFTNETFFNNKTLPRLLAIIGGGPIGVEMAQAYRRLGAEVVILSASPLLQNDDPEAVDIVRRALVGDGVQVHERVTDLRVRSRSEVVLMDYTDASGVACTVEASHVLVAAGRRPNVEALNLEAADVRYSAKGIQVDGRLRTSNGRIYAAGDVAGGYQFTHLAGYHAGIVIRNALFRLPARVNLASFPRVTYTDPELAQAGMTEEEARGIESRGLRVLRTEFEDIDRAVTDGATEGFMKAMVTRDGRVLGVTIVGRHAGELLLPWTLAIAGRTRMSALAQAIVAYPTLSEVSKKVAGSFYTPALFGARTRFLVRALGWLG